jgi:hypothetical protein
MTSVSGTMPRAIPLTASAAAARIAAASDGSESGDGALSTAAAGAAPPPASLERSAARFRGPAGFFCDACGLRVIRTNVPSIAFVAVYQKSTPHTEASGSVRKRLDDDPIIYIP